MSVRPNVRYITDLTLPELRAGLREVERALGPDCGTVRLYRRIIAQKEDMTLQPERNLPHEKENRRR